MSGVLRIGIIGFDTSHVPAFTRLLNDAQDPFHVPGGRVVAGFPSFSKDLEASYSRVDGFVADVSGPYGVEIVDSAEALVDRVDAVLLESVDGRRHLAEIRPVLAARKPVYVDKPLAASYREAAEIARLAAHYRCPLFSSSSLRFDANIAAVKADPGLGKVLACDAFSPAKLDPTNPGLFWYGIHGVEILYTFMGVGCQSVYAHASDDHDVVVGRWASGRVASMRGIREGSLGYGATVFAEGQVAQVQYSRQIPIYAQLLKEIVPFFQGGPAPVAVSETLEIMAFIEAAIISQAQGREVALSEVMG
jgi:predicted dehydrogenase